MIDYATPEIWLDESIQHDLLITDGTVTVSGTDYSVTGATVTITNDLLEQEAFELNQSLNSGSQLAFGSCESASVTFIIHDNIPTLKGKTIKVYLIPDSDASKMLQIGVYKVDEDKLSADRTKRTVTAYDAMYDILNANVAGWYNSLLPNSSSSVTLGQMRFALTAYFGITQEAISLPNDGLVIKRTIEPETLSGADMIRWICELEGCFGQITNEGKFRYVVLTPGLDDGLFPSDTLYPADDLYPQDVNHDVTPVPKSMYIDVQFEDYNAESITGLTIRADDSDVGVTVGTSGNVYIITGNSLVYGYNATQLTTAATNAFSNMKNRYYRPCTVNAVGNPLHEVGDGIRINTTYRGIVTYILERKLSGIQALRDTYTAQGDQYFSEQLNSIGTQFKQLANKTLRLKADVDGVSAELEEQLDSTVVGSYANITAGQIALKVSKNNLVSDLDDEMSGIDITSHSIDVKSTGTFTVTSSNFNLDSQGIIRLENTISSGVDKLLLSVGSLAQSFTYTGSGVSQTSEIGNGEINVYLGQTLSSAASLSRIRYFDITVRDSASSTTITSNSINVTSGNNTTSITPTGMTIGGNPVLTSNSTLSTARLVGVISQSDTPYVTFGKYLNAQGTSGSYSLKLQTINIGGTRYVMYAEEQS